MGQRSSSTSRPSLDELALRHGTDKSSNSHNYVEVYERHLSHLRDENISVLELGWGGHEDPEKGGSSALMWRDYFPNATVACIDIEEKEITRKHDGIHFRKGSQADPSFIAKIASEFGPFDFVVDDASHVSSLTIESWKLLYPHLKPGGLYFVEDTHSSYHDFFYGNKEANKNPTHRASGGAYTALQYFQRMSDEVNYLGRGWDWDLFPKKYWLGYSLEYVMFMFNLVIIRKRGEGTWPS